MYYKTAREVWLDLEERFGQTSAAQLYSLQEQLAKISQENDMSIAEHYTRMKVLWDNLDNASPFPACVCTNYTRT